MASCRKCEGHEERWTLAWCLFVRLANRHELQVSSSAFLRCCAAAKSKEEKRSRDGSSEDEDEEDKEAAVDADGSMPQQRTPSSLQIQYIVCETDQKMAYLVSALQG